MVEGLKSNRQWHVKFTKLVVVLKKKKKFYSKNQIINEREREREREKRRRENRLIVF